MSKLTRELGGLQNFLVGTGLIAIGGCLGILLGSLLDAPRLVVNRFYKPVQTVQLETVETAGTPELPDSVELSEYRALQEEQPKLPKAALPGRPKAALPGRPKAAIPPLPVVSATRSESEAAPAKPEAAEVPAAPSAKETKEALIASIKKTTAHPVPELASLPEPVAKRTSKPDPVTSARAEPKSQASTPSQLVVQVAAYADVPTALRLVSGLQQSGFDAYISPKSAAGPYPHRVRVRPGGNQRVKELSQRLEGAGYNVWTTRE